MRWYFSLTPWLPLRLLAFAWLVYAVVVSAFGSFIKGVALFKVILGVFGASSMLFAALVIIFGYTSGLALLIFPVVCYFGPLFILPVVWRQEVPNGTKVWSTLALLVGGALAASAAQWVAGTIITWVADLNPCAAWRVGVTGSIPPPSCP